MPLDVGGAIRASAAAPRFATLIATDVHALAELGESRCAANPAVAELCSTLLADHGVPVCDCDGKGLTDDDARIVALFLCANTGVKALDLDRNSIGDAGAEALAAALAENNHLQTLRLWSNRIGDEGASALAAALAKNEALRTLIMHENLVTEEGEAALRDAAPARVRVLARAAARISGAVEGDDVTPVKVEADGGRPGEVNPARLLADLRKLGTFGATRAGGVSRPQFSEDDAAARGWLARRAAEAGLAYREDAAGNAWVRLDPPAGGGAAAAGRVLWVGSHLDSVPNGGALDGALGVLTAFEALRALRESGRPLACAVEAVAFADEEGAYGGFFGSRGAVLGVTAEEAAAARGRDGGLLADALRGAGFDPARVGDARRDASSVAGYLELHIEQGAVLAEAGVPIGVVTAIAGVLRVAVAFDGRADHAGTTPMGMRRDAARGLGHLLARAHTLPAAVGAPDAVVTCGRVDVEPGAENIVPARAVARFDVRDRDPAAIAAIEEALRRWAREAADAHGLACTCTREKYTEPVPLDEGMQRAVARAAESLGLPYRAMPSGAGHDAQVVARKAPAGMVFVPSVEGRSHSPLERTRWAHILAGARVLHSALRDLASEA